MNQPKVVQAEVTQGFRKEKQGVVTRRFGDKSIVVLVERCIQHPVFKKYVRRRKNYHVHDEGNVCQPGQSVTIRECRPMSRLKRWTVVTEGEKLS